MIKAIKGTKDLLPSDAPRWHYLEDIVKKIFTNFNYKEIRTPIFELTSLFARSIGEETDIVGKEMYTFEDMSGTSITLKPEMTAGVVRAFIEHSLGAQQQLTKLYYISPMFRQEKPQAGRYRQFHQFGAEAIGSISPFLDAEMIQMSYEILRSLGLKDLLVKINSVGTPEVREKYKFFLRNYLEDKKDNLSTESQRRFDTNVLRIFDSKNEVDQQIMNEAPPLLDFLGEESLKAFKTVKMFLTNVGIPYEVDKSLVRGLDYYTLTTFEIISGSVGSQTALCGGGRYDYLVQELGGKFTPAVGFAAGIERILLACENEKSFSLSNETIDVYLIQVASNIEPKTKLSLPVGMPEFDLEVANIATLLRRQNISCDYDYLHRSVKAQMREANKFNARFALFIGGDEYEQGKMNLKDMVSSEQKLIPIDNLSEVIDNIKN